MSFTFVEKSIVYILLLKIMLRGMFLRSIKIAKIIAFILLLQLSLLANVIKTGDAPKSLPQSIIISFEALRMKKVNSKYHIPKVPGAKYFLKPGAPLIPYKFLVYKVPICYKLVDYKVTVTKVTLKGYYRILPTPQPQKLRPIDRKQLYKEDPSIYESDEPYPRRVVELEVKRGIDPISLEDVNYIFIRIFAVTYYPLRGLVYFVKEVKIEFTWSYVSEAQVALQASSSLDAIIITSSDLEPAAVKLAQWKNTTGITTRVFTVEWINSSFTGKDLPEKIRNFINYTKNTYGITYVIILGDDQVVPARRAYIPEGDPDNPNDLIETDLYYADLQGTWDTDNDGNYGEVEDNIDGVPDVIVGRLPAKTLDEANILVDKIMNYTIDYSWFRKVLFLGTTISDDYLHPEGEILKDYIEYNNLLGFTWTKLYEGLGNLTRDNVINEINKGYGIVNFAGHGNVNGWAFGSGEAFLDTDVDLLANGYKLPIIATMSCLTGDFADTLVCIGEKFLLKSGGGAIVYLGATDVAWGYVGDYVTWGLAGEIDWRFISAFKALEEAGVTPTPGLMHVKAITDYLAAHGKLDLDWYTVVEYGTLLGDPSIQLVGTGTPPPPNPPPKLYGYIVDINGNPVPNVTVRLYLEDGTLFKEYNSSDGYYEFVDLPPDTYKIAAYRDNVSISSAKMFYYPRVNLEVNMTYVTVPPNTILIVVDNDGNFTGYGVAPEDFIAAIQDLGYNIYEWKESEKGNPPLSLLLSENVTLVIWHVGTYYSKAVDDEDANNLIEFIKNGGRLLLEGEDIAFDHRDDQFMLEVARAVFLRDIVHANITAIKPLHPVLNGTEKLVFTETPPYPDGVDVTNGGVLLAKYTGTDYGCIVVYDGVALGENKGARVVYFSFPVHYLNASQRTQLIRNAVRWLLTSYVYSTSTNATQYYPGSYVKIMFTIRNGSDPLTGITVYAKIFFPNGSLAGELNLVDDGTNGDETPSDGVYTGSFYIEEAYPAGTYSVYIEAKIPDYGIVKDQVSFSVVKEVTVSITLIEAYVENAKVVIKVSIVCEGGVIEGAEYSLNSSPPTAIPSPEDGAYDEPKEVVSVTINGSQLSDGYYTVSIRGWSSGVYSQWLNLSLRVRTLGPRYHIVALTLKPIGKYKASDLAKAIGPALTGIWKWDDKKQKFIVYIPGVSSPEKDFEILMGVGYFIYLKSEAKWIEVGYP